MKIKFEIGQEVKVIADGEKGTVISFHVDESGVTYRITSKEVDLAKKEIVHGIKTCKEEELTDKLEDEVEESEKEEDAG